MTERAPAKRSSTYIPGLDGIRAIAFFTVFFAHGTGSILFPATLGVTIFFFLSGYLITTLLRREFDRTGTVALRDFYIRRTLRIFAPLYVTYALAVLVTHLLHQQAGNWMGAISAIFYFFNYAHNIGLHQLLPNGMDVIWSLAVEEHFYLLFPVGMLWMFRRKLSWKRQARMLAWLCVACLAWRCFVVFHWRIDWAYRATDCRFDSILWGSVLALAFNPRFEDKPIVPARWALPSFLVALFLLGCTMLPHSVLFRESVRYTLQSLLLMPIFAFIVAHIENPLIHWLENPVIRYLGWLSYALYLAHDAILNILDRLSPNVHRNLVLGLALTVGYAVILRYTLELPLQHLRARFRRVPEIDRTAPGGHGLIS